MSVETTSTHRRICSGRSVWSFIHAAADNQLYFHIAIFITLRAAILNSASYASITQYTMSVRLLHFLYFYYLLVVYSLSFLFLLGYPGLCLRNFIPPHATRMKIKFPWILKVQDTWDRRCCCSSWDLSLECLNHQNSLTHTSLWQKRIQDIISSLIHPGRHHLML